LINPGSTHFTSPPLEELDRLRQPLTPGEQLVLEFFLENLTTDWEIYIQPHLNGLRPDFVLLSPQKGIAVYEVKDWDLRALEYFYKVQPERTPILLANDGHKTFSMAKNDPFVKIQAYKDCRFASNSDPGCALNFDPPFVGHSMSQVAGFIPRFASFSC